MAETQVHGKGVPTLGVVTQAIQGFKIGAVFHAVADNGRLMAAIAFYP